MNTKWSAVVFAFRENDRHKKIYIYIIIVIILFSKTGCSGLITRNRRSLVSMVSGCKPRKKALLINSVFIFRILVRKSKEHEEINCNYTSMTQSKHTFTRRICHVNFASISPYNAEAISFPSPPRGTFIRKWAPVSWVTGNFGRYRSFEDLLDHFRFFLVVPAFKVVLHFLLFHLFKFLLRKKFFHHLLIMRFDWR